MSRRDNTEPPDPTVLVTEHVCVPPSWMTRAILVLAGVLAATLVGIGFGAVYVYQANQYVQGRGEYRDAEARRLEVETTERLRQAICDLLDQLPEGGLLQRPREKYGCGPGIPVDQLSPDEQAQLSGSAEPTTAPRAPSSPAPRAAPPPTPSATRQPAPPDSAAPTPAAPSSRPPLIDLGRVTDPVCDDAIVCF